MKSLPLGTKLKREFDGLTYEKITFFDDPKQVSEWRSRRGPIFVSDVSAQTNKQYELLDQAE
jgi:hypothetical protein